MTSNSNTQRGNSTEPPPEPCRESEPASPVHEVKRTQLGKTETVIVFARAGARCEFRGCNKSLLEHEVSKRPGNYGEKAHVVAFSIDGPRGKDGDRLIDIDGLDNLMLLCQGCHKEIDDNPLYYTRVDLEQMCDEHRRRIETWLDAAPENQTHIITLNAPIGKFQVAIPRGDTFDAIRPRNPAVGAPTKIDLTNFRGEDEDSDFMEIGRRLIDRKIGEALHDEGPANQAGHISVFAFGPIPLLIYLGSRLGDKVATDLYQRHRDTENWVWKDEVAFDPVIYSSERLQHKGDDAPVGILFSFSGKIDLATIPDEVTASHTLYEMTLDGIDPAPTFLNCKRDLTAFKLAWHKLQAEVAARHGDRHSLALFPAIPAPIAVSIGRDRLPKARSLLTLYDNDRQLGGFHKLMEIE